MFIITVTDTTVSVAVIFSSIVVEIWAFLLHLGSGMIYYLYIAPYFTAI